MRYKVYSEWGLRVFLKSARVIPRIHRNSTTTSSPGLWRLHLMRNKRDHVTVCVRDCGRVYGCLYDAVFCIGFFFQTHNLLRAFS